LLKLEDKVVDLEKKRRFVAASANNEVVDLTGGKVINSLTGFKDPQDALFLGGVSCSRSVAQEMTNLSRT
jgi:hypothetical protein